MNNKFNGTLNQFRLTWGVGRAVVVLFWLVLVAAIAVLFFGILDYTFALPNESRQRAKILFTACAVLAGVVIIIRSFRVPARQAAEMLDAKMSNGRSDISDALSLVEQEDQSEMHAFLKAKAIEEAGENLDTIKFSQKLPIKNVGIAVGALGALALGVIGIRASNPEVFDNVSQRLMHPDKDIPPYSNLRFELVDSNLETVYGGAIDVKVKISGEEITEDVVCLVKNPATGEVAELPVIKESREEFVQRFSNVLAETEFAFKVGTARSTWYSLDVLMQPKIIGTTLEVTPPSYTNKSAENYQLEGGELSLIEGSKVKLMVSSNRPLASGKLVLTDPESGEVLSEVKTTKLIDDKTLEFEWFVKKSGKLSVNVFDVRYTVCDQSLEFSQKSVSDLAPEVALTSPAPRILATPKMKINLKGEAEDDFGLLEVSIVRALKGYRDRGEVVAKNLSRVEYDYVEGVDLGSLGVVPGQVLEFYLEAKDYNPTLLGIGSSDPVKVEIISENEYAQNLRNRAVMRDFRKRYEVLASTIRDAKESLSKLEEAIKSGDSKKIKEARKQAEQAHKNSKQMLDRFGNDFQAFDMEGRLKKIAEDGAKNIEKNLSELRTPSSSQSKADVARMKKRLGQNEKQANQLKQDAEKLAKAAKVMAMAAQFKKIYYNQQSIELRMNKLAREFAFGNKENAAQLKSLGKLQLKNRKALEKFAKDLKTHADALPEEFLEMQESALAFLDKLAELEIEKPMNSGAASAKEGRSLDAAKDAYLALTLLKQLMEDANNGFSQQCKGQCNSQKFRIKPDMQQTMEQMMQALMNGVKPGGAGQGKAGGTGAGHGGLGSDGSTMSGQMRANLPIYGPSRLEFGQSALAYGEYRTGKASRPRYSAPVGTQQSSTNSQSNSQQKLESDAVPLKYKDAVKKYFSN